MQKTKIIDCFDHSEKEINVIIILEEEKTNLIESIHKGLGHIGINRTQYEIFRRGYYWNNMSVDINNFIKKCIICTSSNANIQINPINKQIVSYHPLERIELDITSLSKIYPKNKSEYKYLLCIVDHFSKFAKTYLQISKESKEVLENIKNYINEVGTPEIIQTDNGGEFIANIIKNYLKENDIIFINSSPHHPQTNGVVEAFNKNIINKLEHVLIDNNNNFDIKKGIGKAEEIYNNCIHSITKLEPVKAFFLKDEKDINQIIMNTLKSQNKVYKNFNIIQKGERVLLNETYSKAGNVLKNKFNKKGKYIIPIIIEEALVGIRYSFKVPVNINDLEIDNIYKADYRLIKRCHLDIWEYMLNNIKKTE